MANPQQIIEQLNAQQNLIAQLQQQLAMLQNQQGQPGPPGPQGPPGDDGETPIVQVAPPQIDHAKSI
ncbi:hypothetical protein AGABI1DRAFT_134261 [Agaricus bisporus var. burnettii JB137-S8]|uniref:Uncharacterized protein n=1 Tax=Agaricus bisporus var. burnettii (strain JB137-S8 / ATCC MYA-4627 / FGSC 10392) TaxID=597362 RepID=K5WSI3_AGABU|nr:uncharacterized protein AGABI1DRAFT_134261 [Agaricus bisporus var. burnettii JB137-S8]EKM73688.1 hypothetical protein AGABI1DRAFT_134261 [Agaricus bisporus var. burnettii JB137-S8]